MTSFEVDPADPQYILRKAFDCAPDGKAYLPDSVLWRQKEQFSDGVGYSWIDGYVVVSPSPTMPDIAG